MEEEAKKGEIILYQPEGGEFHLEVRLEDDSVWLTQAQMAELFGKSISVISRHISNVFTEKELDAKSNLHFLQIANSDKPVKLFSLDVIISVGYRVKSFQGTQFRRWANQVLKEHLLKGASINQRFLLAKEHTDQQLVQHEQKLQEHESHFDSLNNRVVTLEKQVEFFVKAQTPPNEGIFSANAFWSGYEFAAQLVRSAKSSIVIVDPFGDDVALGLLSKKKSGIDGILYSSHISKTLKEETFRLNRQNPQVELRPMREVHDRFIIIDEMVYHVGASIKDLGNKLTAFSVLHFVTGAQLLKMID